MDITERILNALAGGGAGGIESDEPVIVVADDLAPSETVQMDKDKILLVTVSGRGDKDCAAIARYRGENIYE